MIKEIKIANCNKKAIIDSEDYDKIKEYNWFYQGKHVKTFRNDILTDMSRFILNDFTSPVIDHKDLDPFNNRKNNLRPTTHALNHANTPKRKGKNSSKYKGVSYRPERKVWRATIVVNGKQIFLGDFTYEINAAIAYNKAALKYFKEFAIINEVK